MNIEFMVLSIIAVIISSIVLYKLRKYKKENDYITDTLYEYLEQDIKRLEKTIDTIEEEVSEQKREIKYFKK